MKYYALTFLLLLVLLLTGNNSKCQIKVFERPPETYIKNSGIFPDSEKRTRINLNGIWQVSFDGGKNYNSLNVPLSYNYEGNVLFRKTFIIDGETLLNSSFLLVCEGINYESKIKINNYYITKNTGGNSPIIILIDENILRNENNIEIEVSNKLDNFSTLPFDNQINYSNNYGGINKDIYLLGIPKVFVSNSFINYSTDNENLLKVTNNCIIRSTNMERLIQEDRDFSLQTVFYNKTSGEELISSEPVKFQIDNFSQKTIENKFSVRNPEYWTPENPELYLIKTLIYYDETLIDELTTETGFTDIEIAGNNINLNKKSYFLKGINFHEESVKYGTAPDYTEIEKDLTTIKNLGFNCIRTPGQPAGSYIINACNRIGLFLLQDFSFNEVPGKNLTNNRYLNSAYEYLENIVKSGKNNVSIFAWGIGNNFDVTSQEAANYARNAKGIIRKYDNRPVFYTTRNYSADICSDIVEFRGINYYTHSIDEINNSITELPKKPTFVSSYGVVIDNDNRNGYSDIFSIEYQTKFLTDCYLFFHRNFLGSFISSYSDWTAGSPLNLSFDINPYLKTEGIFTFSREPKQAVNFLKYILSGHETPKIMEGSPEGDKSYFFIISGIFAHIILLILLNKFRKAKEVFYKGIFKPKLFFEITKEQTTVPFRFNLILSALINFGISLYFSSIFYFFRNNNSFDVFLANLISSDFLKILVSEYISSPYKFIIFTFLIFFILQILISALIYFISLFTKSRSNFKNLYTVMVWSSMPMLIFLPIGTVIFKLSGFDTFYIFITLYLYLILIAVFLYRVITGIRILLEIKKLRAALYGLLAVLCLFSGLYFFLLNKNTIAILNLLQSYN